MHNHKTLANPSINLLNGHRTEPITLETSCYIGVELGVCTISAEHIPQLHAHREEAAQRNDLVPRLLLATRDRFGLEELLRPDQHSYLQDFPQLLRKSLCVGGMTNMTSGHKTNFNPQFLCQRNVGPHLIRCLLTQLPNNQYELVLYASEVPFYVPLHFGVDQQFPLEPSSKQISTTSLNWKSHSTYQY